MLGGRYDLLIKEKRIATFLPFSFGLGKPAVINFTFPNRPFVRIFRMPIFKPLQSDFN